MVTGVLAGQPVSPADSGLRVVLEGRFAVAAAGDAQVRMPHSSARVVAFLAVHGHRVSRVTVADKLWSTATTEHAAAALRTALWRLGPVLGRRLIVIDEHDLALHEGVEIDFRATARCAREILSGSLKGDRIAALAQLRDAGDLLPDWYDDWVVLERECFRQLRIDALERLCRELSAADRYAEAVQAGLAAVAAEPLREGVHEALIAAHVAEGNHADAIRQYRLLHDMLRRHLGLAPSQAVRDTLAGARW